MANFDGPTYTLTPGTIGVTTLDGALYAVKITEDPVFTLANLGLSGGGGGGPVEQEINGYGYSHSG